MLDMRGIFLGDGEQVDRPGEEKVLASYHLTCCSILPQSQQEAWPKLYPYDILYVILAVVKNWPSIYFPVGPP